MTDQPGGPIGAGAGDQADHGSIDNAADTFTPLVDAEVEVPESAERIQATKTALDKLVEAARPYAHRFNRPIERVEYDYDPLATRRGGGPQGDLVERRVPVDNGGEGLDQVDFWAAVDEGDESQGEYRLVLAFPHESPAEGAGDEQVMLSRESAYDLGFNPAHAMAL